MMSQPPPKRKDDSLENYNKIAETVGGVPSFRMKDNLVQGLVVAVGTVLCAIIGLIAKGFIGLMVGALVGLILFGLGSGFVLMVLGFVRLKK